MYVPLESVPVTPTSPPVAIERLAESKAFTIVPSSSKTVKLKPVDLPAALATSFTTINASSMVKL